MKPHWLAAILTGLVLLLAPANALAAKPKKAPAKPRTSAEAQRQRKQAQQQMANTSRELTAAERSLSEKLRQIAALEENITRSQARSAALKHRLDSIGAKTKTISDSIAAGEAELQRLRDLYVRAVRSSRKNRREMNALTFIFSAETFRQAWRRMRYLEEYGEWRKRKAQQINDVVDELNKQKARLEELKRQTSALRSEALTEERRLRNDRAKLQDVAGSLKGKTRELNGLLKRQQSTLKSLDDEIERLIQQEEAERRRREAEEEARRKAEEAKRKAEEAAAAAAAAANPQKPSDKPAKADKPKPEPAPSKQPDFKPVDATVPSLSGSFASQKGKLPSPLSHTYVIALGFGRQQHRSVSNLEVDNPGIDLESSKGATARAVFDGTVSAVFVQEGLGHVVLVRHGNYLTVYANVESLKVKKGDKVKTGDVIGTAGASDVNPSRSLLHFEIRKEREKLDPRQWLKR